MYYGFLEDKPSHRAWFPRRCVEQLGDPLDDEATGDSTKPSEGHIPYRRDVELFSLDENGCRASQPETQEPKSAVG